MKLITSKQTYDSHIEQIRKDLPEVSIETPERMSELAQTIMANAEFDHPSRNNCTVHYVELKAVGRWAATVVQRGRNVLFVKSVYIVRTNSKHAAVAQFANREQVERKIAHRS